MSHLTTPATIKNLEHQRIAAMMAADVDALDGLLHPDLLFGHTDGHSEGKDAYLARFRSGSARYFDARQQIEHVTVVGDAALVSSHLRMRAELATGTRQLNVVGLTVWVAQAGTWRMIAHQPTVVGF